MSEIEFKFCIPPQQVAAVRAAMQRAAHQKVRLQAHYFDTPDNALSARCIAFRLRKEGERWVQTVKTPGAGPLAREEHNVDMDCPLAEDAPAPQPQLHAGSAAGTQLLDALRAASGPLAQTYGTDIDRTTRLIRRPAGVVELAFDTGRIIARQGTPRQTEAVVCELEIELKEGASAGLDTLIMLATEWAKRFGLCLSTTSKAQRGEQLLRAEPQWPAIKAQQPRFGGKGKYEFNGAQLQRSAIAQCLGQVLGNISDIAGGQGSDEHIHQLRIGLRRLRTALQELGPLAPRHINPAWAHALKAAFQQLGALQDQGPVLNALTAEWQSAGAPRLPQPYMADRPAAEHPTLQQPPQTAQSIVHADALQAALIGLMGLTAQEGPHQDAIGLNGEDCRNLLQSRLETLHRKIRKASKRFATLPFEEQHRLRKRLKRLRYLTELLAPALTREGATWLTSLQPALAALGRLSDEQWAHQALRGITATTPEAWFGVGWTAARQPATVAACVQALGHITSAPCLRRAK